MEFPAVSEAREVVFLPVRCIQKKKKNNNFYDFKSSAMGTVISASVIPPRGGVGGRIGSTQKAG